MYPDTTSYNTRFKPGDLAVIVEHRLASKWGKENVLLEPTGYPGDVPRTKQRWQDAIKLEVGATCLIVDVSINSGISPLVLLGERLVFVNDIYLEPVSSKP